MTVNLNNKSYLLHVKSNSHLFFFSRCPFLLNLDLIGIANRFAQFNLPAFALGTLLLIPCANKKAQQIQVRDDDEMIGTFLLCSNYNHIVMTIAVFLLFPGLSVCL